MDDYLACSDLCEENGFQRQAELLRSISRQGRKAYVVVERGSEYDDCIYEPQRYGDARWIYLDHSEAERVALEREILWYRENDIWRHCYKVEDVTNLSEDELSHSISRIIGEEFALRNHDKDGSTWHYRPIPPYATDDQMRRIVELFTLKFYYVVETEFASLDRPSGDS